MYFGARASKGFLKFHSFHTADWKHAVTIMCADASESNRPDGSGTCGNLGGLGAPEFLEGKEADVNLVYWRSFRAPGKSAGSNGAESQAIEFGEETLWIMRLM